MFKHVKIVALNSLMIAVVLLVFFLILSGGDIYHSSLIAIGSAILGSTGARIINNFIENSGKHKTG